MKKFIHDNSIQFLTDSIAVDWLLTYGIDVEAANSVLLTEYNHNKGL